MQVWSDRDVAITRASVAGSRAWVRDAPYRFEVLAGVSHWIPEEAPERLAPLVLAQLHERPTPAAS